MLQKHFLNMPLYSTILHKFTLFMAFENDNERAAVQQYQQTFTHRESHKIIQTTLEN